MKNRNHKKLRHRIKDVDMRRGIFLLPNILTTANLFCGFFSIIQSLKGNYAVAAWLVVLAIFFDMLDGRVARMTGSSSDFGAEYDSLSDIVTFIVAPSVLSYLFGLKDFGKIGIAAGFLFLGCGALRLARFNVQSAHVEKNDFQGLPVPSAGGVICTYIIFYLHVFGAPDKYPFILVGLVIGMALLMVSAVRYKSFKRINRTSFVSLFLIIALIVVMAIEPQIMFFAFGVVYVLIGLVGWVWKSPQRIRGIRDLWRHFYEAKHEDIVFEEESEDDFMAETTEDAVDESSIEEAQISLPIEEEKVVNGHENVVNLHQKD